MLFFSMRYAGIDKTYDHLDDAVPFRRRLNCAPAWVGGVTLCITLFGCCIGCANILVSPQYSECRQRTAPYCISKRTIPFSKTCYLFLTHGDYGQERRIIPARYRKYGAQAPCSVLTFVFSSEIEAGEDDHYSSAHTRHLRYTRGCFVASSFCVSLVGLLIGGGGGRRQSDAYMQQRKCEG
ncbi:hypothetical protein BDZ91DRAFT_345202 [Kalaharituber pfeilii]|nr:hypothetical protein BDZ91DRAFT_345202 [Kalaharituber pfeilii]